MLILAGITITYVLGDNGIIQLVKDAKNQTENAIQKEQEDIANLVELLKEEKLKPEAINIKVTGTTIATIGVKIATTIENGEVKCYLKKCKT